MRRSIGWGLVVGALLLGRAQPEGTAAVRTLPAAVPRPPGARTLIVLLDAVPYATMDRLTAGEEPVFEDFAAPVPLISTFPSSTSIALPGILGDVGLELSPGYEARFFDRERGERRGGGLLSYYRIQFPWREFFDWNRKGPVRNALHAARPIHAGIREMERALAAFEASGSRSYMIYIADTDTAVHLHGPTGLEPMLRELDAALRDLRRRVGPELRVVLLSDHGIAGGDRLRNVLPDVQKTLASRGWRLRRRLETERDVVLTPFGLVSSFEAYVEPSHKAELSVALAGVPGVELCVARTAGGWRVDAADYSVTFERRTTDAGGGWRWETRGDAGAGLAGVLETVAAAGEWVPDAELLAASAMADYPDPLYRLATAFGAVKNPASIVCSTADGFMYGSRGTERTARWIKGALRWTHGSLGRDASMGFLMTSFQTTTPDGSTPAALRFDAALGLAFPETVGSRPR